MTDPVTLGPEGAPYLAVDLQPDDLLGVFVLDESELDGPDVLGWGVADQWVNVVCDVRSASFRQGVGALQGVLTQAEAGVATVVVSDTDHELDPLQNGDTVHKGTPFRLRAWGYAPVPVEVEQRRNRVPNPHVTTATTGWSLNAGTGGVATLSRQAAGGPDGGAHARATWTIATTALGSGQLRADGRTSTGLPIVVTPGEKVSAAIRARASIAQRLACVVTWFDAAGTQTGISPTSNAGTAQVVAANTWVELKAENLTVPAGAVRALVVAQAVAGTGSALWPIGATLDATMAQLETGATAGTYFDGSTADDADLTVEGALSHGWTGTADASESVQNVVELETDLWDVVLFTGELDSLDAVYLPDDPPLVTLTAVDLIAALAAWESEGRADPGVGAGDTLRGRVDRVLAEMGVAGAVDTVNSDSTYFATLNPSVLDQPWANILDAQEAELGRVWVNRANQLVLRGRHSELSGPVRGTLSDLHGEAPTAPHCCVATAAVVYGAEQMANVALGSRRILTGEPDSPVVRSEDAWSRARYGQVTVDRTGALELQTEAQVDDWTEAVVLHGSRPELRVDSVQPLPAPHDLDSAVMAWPAVMGTELGDRWLFQYRPDLGNLVERTVGVVGIRMELTPEAFLVEWVTMDAPSPGHGSMGWFVLDVSELDSGDLLAPYSQPL